MWLILAGIAAFGLGKLIELLHVDNEQERRWKQLKEKMCEQDKYDR
jgi:hypothetical protein